MSLDNDNTVPQVLYNTRDPHSEPSELYVIHGVILKSATDPIKRWVIKEEHGYWDEAEKAFKNRAKTLLPEDPKHCVSLDEVLAQVTKQVLLRVKEGFKYQMEWYPYEPPFYRKYELSTDGAKKRYP
jgi:hypothetical protein